MELTHKLTYNNTTTVIEEPIGFDDLQSTLKRHEYHGMGAEVSLGNLEFYGAAYTVIANAYAADIDSEVLYEVFAGSETVYSGQLDLSTYSVKQGDYRSVQVKVGEIGAKTTFNNRVDKEVDVDDPKTIDGAAVSTPTWRSLHIPIKHLSYTNSITQESNYSATGNPFYHVVGTPLYAVWKIGTKPINEFGVFNALEPLSEWRDNLNWQTDPQYYTDADFESKFGQDTRVKVWFSFKVKVSIDTYYNTRTTANLRMRLIIRTTSGTEIHTDDIYQSMLRGNTYELSLSLTGELDGNDGIRFYTEIEDTSRGSYDGDIGLYFDVQKGSYIRMQLYDNIPESNPVDADMLLVHDALNVVSHAISENALSVKSEWYQLPESHWNAGSIPAGGSGALKALTNGYKIRGLFTDGDTKRNMPLSFKSLIESLSALDCIGWGFSRESGADYVRVERWDWFYKNTTILTLTDVAEVQTDIEPDRIPTELKIGYKKYATQEQYNSIESPHGTRTFVNGIKALTKAITKECEFVADNYAIEETRRARTQKDATEESTYDENIFVFELQRSSLVLLPSSYSYAVTHSAVNGENVGRANEFINAKLTPRHMAARWRDFLFAANNSTPFRFTSGEINYKASFSVIPASAPTPLQSEIIQSLKTMAVSTPQTEDDNITYSHAKFKAEKITFTCPLSIAQYKTVRANPYGLVSVNGALGWILDFKYSFHDGTANFTLLAKY